MTSPALFDIAEFEAGAAEVARVLRALSNERRLMILCKLLEWGEANVTSLGEAVGLAYRREGQTLWYRIADPRIERLLATLYDLYCPSSKAN